MKKKVLKKCPICNSSEVGINEYSEFYCKNCGFVNTKRKKANFIDFCK